MKSSFLTADSEFSFFNLVSRAIMPAPAPKKGEEI